MPRCISLTVVLDASLPESIDYDAADTLQGCALPVSSHAETCSKGHSSTFPGATNCPKAVS